MSKQPKCKVCKKPFKQFSSLQTWCSPDCGYELSKRNMEKQRASEAKLERKELRKRKEALKNKSAWLKDAQDNSFNPYIRTRDAGSVCISCGKSEQELKINNPIAMVCGHYLSVGAYPELRFHPFNAHLQCTRCNGGAGKYGQFNSKAKTVTQEYRVNLIKKIGLKNVEWLEGKQEIQHLSIQDIKDIKTYYKEQTKLLK